jgi:Asp-tRNA(Asn)/Glu-tRNA(Gln) amidotransferase C subunit
MSQALDPNLIIKIARTAKLSANPSQAFVQKFSQQLGVVVDYVEQLKEVDISHITQTGSARVVTIDDLADDIPYSEEEMEQIRQNIINNFPQRQGNLLVLRGGGIFEN